MRRLSASLTTVVLLTGVAFAAIITRASSADPAFALDNGLAATPYMGWSTYLGMGGVARHHLTEASVEQAADAIVSRGLKAAGYNIVWIDGGWWSGQRDAAGNMIGSSAQFPDGMAAVADYIHNDGLLAGIYTDAGTDGCGGPGLGSYGHYQQDADQFAAWGFDAVKIDFCGGFEQGLQPQQAYAEFSAAIQHNASGRPMLIDLCNPTADRYHTWQYAPEIANSWRTDNDIGNYQHVPWARVMRNLDSDSLHPAAAGPGAWNNPDYLGPEMGMTPTEAQAQFDLWAIVSAPLMIGTDVRTMSDETVAMLTNPEVIAIDQDVTGGQGTVVTDHRGLWQVWVKRLASGDVAVALLNRGPTAHDIRTSAAAVGLPAAASYALRDVVAHATTYSGGTIEAGVPAHGAVLFRVSPKARATPRQPPAISVTPPRAIDFPNGLDVLRAGNDNEVTVTVANRSANSPINNLHVRLTTPPGWRTVDPMTVPHRLAAGESTTLSWQVRPEAPAGRQATIEVAATYSYSRGRAGSMSFAEQLAVRKLSALRRVGYLSDAPWVMAKTTEGDVRANATPSGSALTLHGVTYPEGVFAHSVASIDYYLGGNCSELSATVGIDDSARGQGSVRIEMWADNHRVYRSPVLTRDGPPVTVDVPLGSATGLWIDVSDAGDGSGSDDADLADARLFCS